MEENQSTKENEEKTAAESELTPEEVLERAKKENEKLGDERQRERLQWGNYAGFIAVMLSCVVVMLVMTFLYGTVPTGIMAIFFTGVAAQTVVQACVMQRKKLRVTFSVCAALVTAGTLMYWVLWILELCEVNI